MLKSPYFNVNLRKSTSFPWKLFTHRCKKSTLENTLEKSRRSIVHYFVFSFYLRSGFCGKTIPSGCFTVNIKMFIKNNKLEPVGFPTKLFIKISENIYS